MTKNTVYELLQIAEESKNIGEYGLANRAFALAVWHHFKKNPHGSWFGWETRDKYGVNPGEVYNDLAYMFASDPTDNNFCVGTCVPVPMLRQDVAIAILKSSVNSMTERVTHNRRKVPDEVKRMELEKRLLDFATSEEIQEAVYYVFDPADIVV